MLQQLNSDIPRLLYDVQQYVFPQVYASAGGADGHSVDRLVHHIRHLAAILVETVQRVSPPTPPQTARETSPDAVAEAFVSELPTISRLLHSDVEAVLMGDPAASSRVEVICCYPAITVMLHYRVAHVLHRLGVPLLPRMMTERAHAATGVDIHPAAQIGDSFAIDHGTGIVVGATAIIGSHVMLYQGVTLGALHIRRDEAGVPIDLPRHPIIEDRVTIYSNSTILGRIRIGHDSVVGGNLWITCDVPPGSHLRQHRPVRAQHFTDGAGI